LVSSYRYPNPLHHRSCFHTSKQYHNI
jgi:hypothetical protein